MSSLQLRKRPKRFSRPRGLTRIKIAAFAGIVLTACWGSVTLFPGSSSWASTVASFTYPLNGATWIDTTQPFTWSADTQATSYRLTIGTSQGASDLVDSGRLTATSYAVPGLPAGKTLWARLTTQYSASTATIDISFTARGRTAVLTRPTDGAQNIDPKQPFTWNAVSGGEWYWLWIGTSPGANDLVSSGKLTSTSYLAKNLPAGKTLYARLWTMNNGIQANSPDVSFTVAGVFAPATLTNPRNGANDIDTLLPFTWNAVAGVDGYWLWIGTSSGANDLVNSGMLTKTSYAAQGLPPGKTLYARLWTVSGGRFFNAPDVAFTASPAFTSPINGALNIDATQGFSWQADSRATSYRVTIGRTKGSSDLSDSGQLTVTSFGAPGLPAGTMLWAELTTQYRSTARTSDVSFTAAPSFVYPTSGSLSIDGSSPFKWSEIAPANGATPSYKLTVGTNPAGRDLFETGPLAQTSYTVPTSALPTGKTLYARVAMSPGDGSTSYADTVFTVVGTQTPSAQMIYPAAGDQSVDVSRPFKWSEASAAQAYRLTISSSSGLVRDSGPVHFTQYFAEDLPVGSYSGKLSVEAGGQWRDGSPFSFVVTSTGYSMANEIAAAQEATDFVRRMADDGNRPYPWTELYKAVHDRGATQALCSDFAPTLIKVMQEMRVTARLPAANQPVDLDIGFLNNPYDVHTLVKMWNSDVGDWLMLDPMFDVTMKRAGDGQWASPQNMRDATRSQSWNSITYVFLGGAGDWFARNYYIDYPLLFLRESTGSSPDPRPYMTAATLPSTSFDLYAVSSRQSSVTVEIDGRAETLALSDGLTRLFYASSVALPAGSSAQIQLYRAKRYKF